ncbi:MAG: DapH/DapD/GlmU-related protein [Mucilaginibacter sp.]|uniref:serine O-acetyltransferase n=1 Tax=Mucilaginibacter sp. TaxID=1882438 RepID=UPI0031AF07AF
MNVIKDIKLDLYRLRTEFGAGNVMALLANRGVHALINYRISHYLYTKKIPLLPLLLTRVVQIFYAIDIDYKAILVIIHGIGVVIGQGAIVRSNTTIYHGVTLGRKKQGLKIPPDDGFPIIQHNCVLGAGAKIIGPVRVGENCVIGPNCVVTDSIPPNTIIKLHCAAFETRSLKPKLIY